MITKKLVINGEEYSVSSTTMRGIEEAEQYLRKSLKNFNSVPDAMLAQVPQAELEIPTEDAIEKLEESEPVKPKRTRKKKSE